MIYDPEDLIEIIASARRKFGGDLRAFIISRSQAIRFGNYMDEHGQASQIIIIPGPKAHLAERYAHKAVCNHVLKQGSLIIKQVAPFSKYMGVDLYLRDDSMPPQVLVKDVGLITWVDEDDRRFS